ncbi:MAG TPA: hypothetical protein VNI61_01180 [Gemmatimonadales bacterium]|nr:hypothetical protein [Gemmatimonadales bacterium]
MRTVLALAALTAPPALTAQVSFHLALGARHTTALVRDSIVAPFDLRPDVGPVAALTAAVPLEHGWAADLTLDFSWSDLARHEERRSVEVGALRTVTGAVALRRGLAPGFTARVGVGGLKYWPEEDRGVFRDGAGPVIALGTLGIRYDLPLPRGRGLALEARYDLHRFITPALRSVGFTAPRAVHRLALLGSVRVWTARESAP